MTIKSKDKKGGKKKIDMSHDRKKKYVLEEGVPVPFLQDLGVMTQDGKIVRAKSDKFRQINRFLELSKISFRSWIREENLQSWILAVERVILPLPCIITCMN